MSLWCGDYEPVQAHNERQVKARKPHKCSACKLMIRPGDTYTREAWLFEGKWEVVIRCGRCQLIFEHLQPLCDADGDCVAAALDCGHEYFDRWGVEPPTWLAALAFWLPGDPLPATRPCTEEAKWMNPPRWFAQHCSTDVWCWRSDWQVILGPVDSCRTNGNPSHTEACS